MQQTLSEQFITLALDGRSGMFPKHLSGVLGFYLAAAGLLELIQSDTLRLDDNQLVMLQDKEPESTGQPHLDLIVNKIKKKKQPESIKNEILSLYTWNSRALQERLIESMEARKLLEKNKKHSLLIFNFTFWKLPDDSKELLTESMRIALLGDEQQAGQPMLCLALLATHAKLLQDYFSPKELEQVKQRLVYLEEKLGTAAIRVWHHQVRRAYTEAVSSWSI